MTNEKRLDIFKAFEETLTFPNAKEFWHHYSRLTGNESPLSLINRPPIEQMIDKTTGYSNIVMHKAFVFFVEYVWSPLQN